MEFNSFCLLFKQIYFVCCLSFKQIKLFVFKEFFGPVVIRELVDVDILNFICTRQQKINSNNHRVVYSFFLIAFNCSNCENTHFIAYCVSCTYCMNILRKKSVVYHDNSACLCWINARSTRYE